MRAAASTSYQTSLLTSYGGVESFHLRGIDLAANTLFSNTFFDVLLCAKQNGIRGFTAEVLRENKPMQRVFNKSECEVKSQLNEGIYSFQLDFK